MRRKSLEFQNEAVRLRKQGLSYSSISRTLGISRSTLSCWLRAIPIPPIRKAMLSEAFRNQGARLHAERLEKTSASIKAACDEIGPISLRELKIAGAMLYWAEGSKEDREIIDIANSDPRLIQLALRWLRVVCEVPNEKIRIQMHIHTDLDLEECLRFWGGVTGLPRGQFQKTQIKASSLGHRKKRLYFGTVKIRVCDKQLYRRIQGWIRALHLGHTAPVAQLDRAEGF